MFNQLKQLQDLRKKAKDLENSLAVEKIEVEKNGVKLVMDGNQKVLSVTIEPNNELSRLESVLPDLFNDATNKAKRVVFNKMQSGGFNLPGF